MKTLKDDDIIRLMREVWSEKVRALSEEIDLVFKTKVGKDQKNPISSGLKVKSRETGILYTVEEVGPDSVRLLSPDGEETLMVNGKDLEEKYELD